MKIVDIHKKYKNKIVLDGVSFDINPGDCVAVLGSNGSGKSTLLSILAGVTERDSGVFLCDNTDLLTNKAVRRDIVSYIPQGNPLFEELTAMDNLKLWYSKEDMDRELAPGGVLNMLGIDDFLNVRVGKMSGGMKKRLSIGCAIAGNPQILLLDEPSAALDVSCKLQIYSYVKKFTEGGGCVIWVTHDMQDLEICTRCLMLKQGKITPYGYNGDIARLVEDMKE